MFVGAPGKGQAFGFKAQSRSNVGKGINVGVLAGV